MNSNVDDISKAALKVCTNEELTMMSLYMLIAYTVPASDVKAALLEEIKRRVCA